MSNTITLEGRNAINLSDPKDTSWIAGKIILSPGKYAVNLESTVTFHYDQLKLNQVALFNLAPLNTGNSEGWYFVVNATQGIQITVVDSQPVYAVILDQINSNDNTGLLTVTFTPLP